MIGFISTVAMLIASCIIYIMPTPGQTCDALQQANLIPQNQTANYQCKTAITLEINDKICSSVDKVVDHGKCMDWLYSHEFNATELGKEKYDFAQALNKQVKENHQANNAQQ